MTEGDEYTNVGKWERWYGMLGDDPEPYGLTETYQIGADWLAGCALIEDWGCGKGWFRTLVEPDRYRGIDGSHSKFADQIVDLAAYTSDVPGIFMRHVLEHDYRWESILSNALSSFRDRMALVLFTPLNEVGVKEIAFSPDPGVPDLSFCKAELEKIFSECGIQWTHSHLETATQYGTEDVWLLAKGK